MLYYEASLSGVIRIIFYFILFSFIVRLVVRLALPYVVKKGEEAMRQRARQFQQQQQPMRKEGEVTIETPVKKDTPVTDEGEYVDYIEIKNQ